MDDNNSSRFSLSIDYTLRISDDLYQGSHQAPNPNKVKTIFHRYSLTGAYRVSDEFVLQVTVPILDGTFEEDGIDKSNISGLSDISLLGTWRPSQIPGFNLNLGFITPTGDERNQPLVGIAVPSVFQLGTGAWQVLLGAGYSRQVGDWNLSTQLNVGLPLETSSQGFKPAESYFLSLTAGKTITDSEAFRFTVQGSYTNMDEYRGRELAHTGSTMISLRPSLVWQINERLTMSGSVDLPVYWDANETGIAAGSTWKIGLNTTF